MSDFSITVDVVDYDPKTLTSLIQRSKDEYKNFRIDIKSDHAMFIEFGTNGVHSDSPGKGTGAKGTKSEAFENIITWYMIRASEPNRDRARAKAYPIFTNIMKNGIPPQPFIRPAVYSVRQMLSKGGSLCKPDTTMRDVCEALKAEMHRNLRDNKTLYGEEKILKSIEEVWGTLDELETGRVDMATSPDGIESSVWNTPYADWNGDTSRALERRAHRDSLKFK